MDFQPIGKFLILIGIIIVAMGIFLSIGFRFFPFGKLPGDIFIRRGSFTFVFPIVSSIILSIILTIILNLIFRK